MTDFLNVQSQPNVTPIRPAIPDATPANPQLEAGYLKLVNTALTVLSLRLLAIIALLGAVGLFAVTIYNPEPWRLYTAAAYAVVVLLPTIWLYTKGE
jgi:hypothetical protein